MLSRNETDPGGEMPPILELRSIADGGDDCRGGLWADALDLGDALTIFVPREDTINLLIEGSNPAIKIAEEIVELCDRFAGHRRQFVFEVIRLPGN
jgi:hypothetical protein